MNISNRARIVWLAVLVALAAVALVVVAGTGDGSDGGTTSTTKQMVSTSTETPRATTSLPKPQIFKATIKVVDGEPAGGVQKLDVEANQQVRLTVTSNLPEEVHLHGYDIEREVAPGKPAQFAFKAKLEGAFDIELHGSETQIGELRVSP